jgi:NAD(P)-dependent dehydrogenase (short-subunit alcohol dehydrogenase family)
MSQKITLITGCSKKDGVGYNLAQELLGRGHKVIATVRNLETSDIKSDGSALDVRVLDLCHDDSIKALIAGVLKDYGYIDVLVNNAANVTIGPAETASKEDLQTTYQTKVFGPLALIQGFLPCMRERKSGLLTTTGSIFCTMPFIMPGLPIYLSALQAFERIQESLAIELAPWNINVVNYHPGPITTSLTRSEGSHSDIAKKHYKNHTEHGYGWFDKNTVWQSAEDVAKPYANFIDSEDKPDFQVYSNDFGRDFAKKFQSDPSANTYRDEFLAYFKSIENYEHDDWHIK